LTHIEPAERKAFISQLPGTDKIPESRCQQNVRTDLEKDNYAYLVPFVEDENGKFLKTIIPSRKATRDYLGGKE